MGKITKYKTPEEKRIAQNKWSKNYYWKNKETIDERARKRYQKKKEDNGSI